MIPKNLWVVGITLLTAHYLSAQNAQLVSAMINGCGTSDGAGEFLVVYSGGSSFNASTSTIDIRYATNSADLDTYSSSSITDTFNDNSTNDVSSYVTSLNNLLPGLGCGDLNFIVATSGTSIAAGSHVLIINDDPDDSNPPTVIDFSGWCGSGIDDVYVLLSSDVTWQDSGEFANSPTGNRFFRSIINGVSTDLNYTDSWASTADGNYVAWNDGGGPPFVYSNYSSCNPSDTQSLPVELLYFKGAVQSGKVHIEWATATEQDNSHFIIERSANGLDWKKLTYVDGHIDSETKKVYRYIDRLPLVGRSYYRLIQFDFSGVSESFNTISVLVNRKENYQVYPNPSSGEITITGSERILSVKALNSLGTPYIIKRLSDNRFDLSQLCSGHYSLIISTQAGTQKTNIIKSDY